MKLTQMKKASVSLAVFRIRGMIDRIGQASREFTFSRLLKKGCCPWFDKLTMK